MKHNDILKDNMYSRKQKENYELDHYEYVLYHNSPTAGESDPEPDPEPVYDPNDEFYKNNPNSMYDGDD